MFWQIVLSIGILFVISILVLQIRGWRSGSIQISRKHKWIRAISAFILLAILSMILIGDRWLAAMPHGVLLQIMYWLLCMCLGIVLMIIALMDMSETRANYKKERRAIVIDAIGPKKNKPQ